MDGRGGEVTSAASVIFHNDICQPLFYYCHLSRRTRVHTARITHRQLIMYIFYGAPTAPISFLPFEPAPVAEEWKIIYGSAVLAKL